ncbi:MAG: hypothetical protein JXR37_06075 [Kiritimatiellae bacterium]|nr:hypothetical protein [Kiritimatiellia bacterium]
MSEAGTCRPIGLHPDNPHYFVYRDKPLILISTAEHYGALINRKFDYVAYFDELHRCGLNLTRVWAGAFLGAGPTNQPKGKEAYIGPWLWSGEPGGWHGEKLDLSQWNPAYFARLADFLAAAAARDIMVELTFFSVVYGEKTHWVKSPMHPANNTQSLGALAGGCHRFITTDNPALNRAQRRYVARVVEACRPHANLYFEVCNEPLNFTADAPVADVARWHDMIIEQIVETESGLPADERHMIAVNEPRVYDAIRNRDAVSVLNQHYGVANKEKGCIVTLLDGTYYAGNRVALADDENWFLKEWKTGGTPVDLRVEGWEFIVGGGSVFNQLNGHYTVDNPAGCSPEGDEMKRYCRHLQHFMQGFDFLAMRKDEDTVRSVEPAVCSLRAISEKGRQYAVYLHHSEYGEWRYQAKRGAYRATLTLDVPPGAYRAEWIDPATARPIDLRTFTHRGGGATMQTPAYEIDIALRLTADRA